MQREKRCAVIGLARAGVPAARFLAERGARVIGYDGKPLEQLSDEARALQTLGVELRAGEPLLQPQHFGIAPRPNEPLLSGIEQCSLVVLSPGLKIHHEPLRSLLEQCEARGTEIIGELELAARHCPAPIIAVTGTKGKSTTVKLIEEMLRACGVDAIRAGNTGTPLVAQLPHLSPQSWAIVEVSSFQLERAPTFKPRVAVLLNLLEDHQDYHPSLEQYWATKLKLFTHQGEGDKSIFNFDDERTKSAWKIISETHPWSRLCSSGRNRLEGQTLCRASVKEGFIGWLPEHQFFPLMPVTEVPLRGEHNLSNVAAAMAAVYAVLGEDETVNHHKEIANSIRNFESLPHRLEIVGEVGGVRFVNDSQGTIPDATIRALEAFAPPITLIAGGRAKSEDAAAFDELGQTISQRAHSLVTIGQDAARIEDAARRAGMDNEKIVAGETLTNALEIAIMRTPQGGTVLLSPACASFDQFASFEARGEAFRAAVTALQASATK